MTLETDYMNLIGKVPIAPTPKVPVKAILMSSEKGMMTPLFIVWKDGTKYKVEDILDVQPKGASRINYKVKIKNRAVNLYYDRNIWYVDKKGT